MTTATWVLLFASAFLLAAVVNLWLGERRRRNYQHGPRALRNAITLPPASETVVIDGFSIRIREVDVAGAPQMWVIAQHKDCGVCRVAILLPAHGDEPHTIHVLRKANYNVTANPGTPMPHTREAALALAKFLDGLRKSKKLEVFK
jgi:hypothetical protein